MLIDTHCHIHNMIKEQFDISLTPTMLTAADPIVADARAHGVSGILTIGTSLTESINALTLAQRYSDVYAVVGIHPNDCTQDWQQDLFKLNSYIKKRTLHKIVAIGEIGLDRYHPDYNLPRQKDAFRAQIECALTAQLPVVIHTRSAADETLTILDEYKKNGLRGVVHCFSEGHYFAQQVIEHGFLLGIGGTLTYPKNEELRAIVRTVDLQHIVLETDAPFLPPQSMRGKQNHPKYIRLIAEYMAELKQLSYADIAKATTANAVRLFNLDLNAATR